MHDEHPVERAPGAENVHLPAPSIWPLVCAAGITLLAFGVVTHLAFSVFGLLLTVRALGGWIEEMRYE